MEDIVLVENVYTSKTEDNNSRQNKKNLKLRISALNTTKFNDDTGFQYWKIYSYTDKSKEKKLCLCGHDIKRLVFVRRDNIQLLIGSSCMDNFDDVMKGQHLQKQLKNIQRKTYDCEVCNKRHSKEIKECPYKCGEYNGEDDESDDVDINEYNNKCICGKNKENSKNSKCDECLDFDKHFIIDSDESEQGGHFEYSDDDDEIDIPKSNLICECGKQKKENFSKCWSCHQKKLTSKCRKCNKSIESKYNYCYLCK